MKLYEINRNSIFSVLTRILPCVLVLVLGSYRNCPANQEQVDWVTIEQEFERLLFPGSFGDSLKSAKNVQFRPAMRSVKKGPFVAGEKLFYEVGWGPMNAGYGIVSCEPDPQKPVYHLSAKGFTNPFTSSFFKVRDYLRCVVDTAGLYPFFFEEHIREGKFKANRWILFDHEKKMAYTGRRGKEEVEAPAFTHSILSLFYSLRSRRHKPGDTMTLDCFVQDKNYRVFFTCTQRETIEVGAGRFNCVVLEPRLEGQGRVFTKKDKIRIWLTDDDHAVPVMVKSKIAIGSIGVKLIDYQGPAPIGRPTTTM